MSLQHTARHALSSTKLLSQKSAVRTLTIASAAAAAASTTTNRQHATYVKHGARNTKTHSLALLNCTTPPRRCFATEKVPVPNLGDSISEGTIVSWSKVSAFV